MIIWGGAPDRLTCLNTGARYDPVTDVWVDTSLAAAPSERDLLSGVWTGTEMIVWGGNPSYYSDLDTGGRYCVNSSGR